MEGWKTDIDNYDESYIEPLKFLFDQAEKRLRWTLEVSDRITTRCYLIMAAIIPLMTVLISVLGRYYVLKELALKNLVSLCWIGMFFSVTAVILIITVLFPRNMHQVGAEPKNLALKHNIDNPDVGITSAKIGYIVLLLNELETHQDRISYTDKQNASRISRFKLALLLVLVGFIIALAQIGFNALTSRYGVFDPFQV